MVRNAAIGLVAFLAGLLTAYLLSPSFATVPGAPVDPLGPRLDALDEALADLDRTVRSEVSRPDVGLSSPVGAEPAVGVLEREIVLMREELHDILEALEARRTLSSAAAGGREAPGSPALYEARQRSWDVVNGALAAQRWTAEDARDLFASWSGLAPAERQALLAAVFSAANRGEIEMEETNGLF